MNAIAPTQEQHTTSADRQFVDINEIATILSISPRTVRDWMRRGVIPFLRITKRTVCFERDVVLAHVRKQFSVPAKDA